MRIEGHFEGLVLAGGEVVVVALDPGGLDLGVNRRDKG